MKRILLAGFLLSLSLSLQAQDTIEDCWVGWDKHFACWEEITQDVGPDVSCTKRRKGGYQIELSRPHVSLPDDTLLRMLVSSNKSCDIHTSGAVLGRSTECQQADEYFISSKEKARLKKEMKAVCATLLE